MKSAKSGLSERIDTTVQLPDDDTMSQASKGNFAGLSTKTPKAERTNSPPGKYKKGASQFKTPQLEVETSDYYPNEENTTMNQSTLLPGDSSTFLRSQVNQSNHNEITRIRKFGAATNRTTPG